MKRMAVAALLLVMLPANAGAWVTCVGKVRDYQVGASGLVQVSSPNLWGDEQGRAICSVGEHWKGVHPETCKAWLQILSTARNGDSNIKIQYGDGPACNQIPTWGTASAPNMIETSRD